MLSCAEYNFRTIYANVLKFHRALIFGILIGTEEEITWLNFEPVK